MRLSTPAILLAGAGLAGILVACASSPAMQNGMSFFVSSTGSGKGGDLGGLEGADRLCQSLATNVGAGSRSWHAYLSTTGAGGVNARDRIGRGPWRNAHGVVIASDLAQLHGTNNLTKQTALTETGAIVNGRGDTPNMHDILTGSQPDGTAIAGSADSTCGNWMNGGEGAAMLGHSDRTGLDDSAAAKSWNSSHLSRGCGVAALKTTGSDSRIYCFATN